MPSASTVPYTSPGGGPELATAVRRGSAIGRYLVLERLGQGGMGVVYAAYDPDLDRKVAIKLLHRHMRGGTDDPASQRLLREAQAMAKLDHPNVVTVHDVGTFEGTVFVAMEFIRGQTMRHWLAEATRPIEDVLDKLRQAGRGLAAAHDIGLVHRDFKPDNVMIAEDGRVRVMDFGLVRAADDAELPTERAPAVEPSGLQGVSLEPDDAMDPNAGADEAMARVFARMQKHGLIGTDAPSTDAEPDAPPSESTRAKSPAYATTMGASGGGSPSQSDIVTGDPGLRASLTKTGTLLGTPAYMSPEQIGLRSIDARSDQFAFGVTAWEALFGEHPFEGDTLMAITAAISDGRMRSPPAGRDLPSAVMSALRRALAVDPAERFEDMSGLVDGLTPSSSGTSSRSIALWSTAVASVVVVTLVATASDEVAPCQGATERVEAVWSDARRSEIGESLAATSVAHAQVTAQKVLGGVDDYARRWGTAHTDACEATRVRGEQSERMLDLRMACLDTRFAELDALLQIFAEADAEVVSRATEAVADLPPLSPCSDRKALAQGFDPPPSDARDAVADLRRRVAEARAAEHTGLFERAREASGDAHEGATALAYRPLLAETGLAHGRILATLGETQSAVGHLEQAAYDGRASGHLTVAAEAEALLVYVVGYDAGRREDGVGWARHAQADVARLPPDASVRADLRSHRGVLAQLRGDSAQAEADLEAALALRLEHLGPLHPDTAEGRHNLGVLYRRLGRYADARAQHERALETRREVFGPEHPMVSDSLTALAAVELREGDQDGARAHYEEALRIRRATFGDDHLDTATSREALALVAAGRRDFAAARGHFAAALKVYAKHLGGDDPRIGRAWLNFGNMEIESGHPSDAVDPLMRAVEHHERTGGRDHPKTGAALASLGLAQLESDAPGAPATLRRAARLLDSDDTEPLARGSVMADLTRALWESSRAEAFAAASAARTHLNAAGPAGKARLEALEAFIANRP